jgi:NADH-quinone oxidoreductase subunit E
MKRYDLRHLKGAFYDRMDQIMQEETSTKEVLIFLFEIGDFTPIQKSADLVKAKGYELMNSLKFNEADWTIVVKNKE